MSEKAEPERYLSAPKGLVDIKGGTKMKVLGAFITDSACPLGAGLECMTVEGYRVVNTKGPKGYAWMKMR